MPTTEKSTAFKISDIAFSFQPIVNIHTGECFGYEAVARNLDDSGVFSMKALLDRACSTNKLEKMDFFLRAKAVETFSRLGRQDKIRLFLRMDSRLLSNPKASLSSTLGILERFRLPVETICCQISAADCLDRIEGIVDSLKSFKENGVKIALSNFGAGFTGLEILHGFEPEFIMIDPFFTREIDKDPKKRLMASKLLEIGRHIGSMVAATGVGVRSEYQAWRDLGADLIQGGIVDSGEKEQLHLKSQFKKIHFLGQQARQRNYDKDKDLIASEIERPEPILDSTGIFDIFEKFKRQKDVAFFPVVNADGEPLGIVREKSFKNYTYSLYGTQLLQNPAFGKSIHKFVTKFPVVDIHTPVEKILEIYSENKAIEGILVVDGMKYSGLLSAPSLLKVLNRKMIVSGRDRNPLSQLPGNTPVFEYVSEALRNTGVRYTFVFVDFDCFKAYNESYGYRQGDKLIEHFSEKLKELAGKAKDRFAGHFGGDDFFLGVRQDPTASVADEIEGLLKDFRKDVEGFYDPSTVKKGYALALDRDGKMRKFPLLTASAVIFELPEFRRRIYSLSEVSNLAAKARLQAKESETKIHVTGVRNLEKLSLSVKRIFGGEKGPGKAGETVFESRPAPEGKEGEKLGVLAVG